MKCPSRLPSLAIVVGFLLAAVPCGAQPDDTAAKDEKDEKDRDKSPVSPKPGADAESCPEQQERFESLLDKARTATGAQKFKEAGRFFDQAGDLELSVILCRARLARKEGGAAKKQEAAKQYIRAAEKESDPNKKAENYAHAAMRYFALDHFWVARKYFVLAKEAATTPSHQKAHRTHAEMAHRAGLHKDAYERLKKKMEKEARKHEDVPNS